MSDVFTKCVEWKDADLAKEMDLYPFYQAIEASYGATEVSVQGRRMIMIGSNNYLGLSADPRVKEAAFNAIQRYGTTASGSRLLNGTLALHEELEAKLARFLRREAAMVVSTGFQTNLAAISALPDRGDIVFADRFNHASLVDGLRLSQGIEQRYWHNDMAHLEELLAGSDPAVGKLIVADGVFSMDGDVCDLPGILALARKYGARVVIDDAHAMGVLGAKGRGTAEYFGLEDELDLVTGTFSKSFASLGGVIAGPARVINYIRHKARSVIFSAALPPPCAAAALKALEILEEEPERVTRLMDIAEKMHNGLRAMGYDTGGSVTPIIPVMIGDRMRCFALWKALFQEGIFTNPVTPPAVSAGRELLRTSYMATHTDAQLDRVLEAFERLGRRLGLIPRTRPSSYVPVQLARPGGQVPLRKSA
ncbi:pyridoxal phosphate-dependent aminotransferase family protein [Archangium gephyra]|uniref:aminotransferase class I/II-fold pyridoxal phosphate-dependent enzyme n=1 Tax=Archangium gephyra TaxID=48 RepID=UPI0035D45357